MAGQFILQSQFLFLQRVDLYNIRGGSRLFFGDHGLQLMMFGFQSGQMCISHSYLLCIDIKKQIQVSMRTNHSFFGTKRNYITKSAVCLPLLVVKRCKG